jgi:ribose/xylose/arabinose/galactoside ABC-type transport system permease subunit
VTTTTTISPAITPTPAVPPATRPKRSPLLTVIDLIMPIGTVLLMVYFTVASPSFLTGKNLMVVATQNSSLMIVAIAVAIMLMAGYVDLSVGSVMAVSGVAAGLAFTTLGELPGILIGLAIGVAVGAVNGVLIGYFNLSPLVVTLGMLAVLRGAAVSIAPTSVFGFPEAIAELGSGSALGVPYLVWIAAIVVIAGMLTMSLLPVGRHIIAIGVNKRAAFLNGISVKPTVFALYCVVGVAAAVAGLLTVARLDSAPSGTLGLGFEIDVLTAVLLGSVPFTGGKGALWRVVIGVWLMGILRNGITLLNIGPEVGDLLTGAVLILAAGLEGIRYYLRTRSS